MTPPTARGERARNEILAAGRAALLEYGPDKLSLRDVARRAGYAPSALYNHFADKDALVVELAMGAVGSLAGHLAAVPPGAAVARLKALGLAYATFAREHPSEYRIIFDCLVNPPHDWERYADLAHPFALIVETCAQGLDDGSLADPAGLGASGMAYGMWALVDGHVHLGSKHLAAVRGPFDEMFDAALDALLRGYASSDDGGLS